MADDEWELIHACTRADLLRDGWLVDVRGWAREAGFQVPVAITASAWNEAVAWDDGDQDEAERRARAVLRAAARAALDLAESGKGDTDRLLFEAERAPGEAVGLKLHIGPGDMAEPVFTVLLPRED